VGAGPGDPGLLTSRGRLSQRAEVVVHDYLCNPALLKWAPDTAERVYAGKKAGAHSLSQDEINALLVDKTRGGKIVVRLKGGDPFIFGRGGEEAEALADAKCPFEIVPGVTSAIAGPAYAGIPVTHRAHNSVLTIFTGHEEPGKPNSSLDFQAIARAQGTKVMLMGIERLNAITGELQIAGMPSQTPVTLVRWATTGAQQTVSGTLENIDQRAREAGFAAGGRGFWRGGRPSQEAELVRVAFALWQANRRYPHAPTSRRVRRTLARLGADVELPTIASKSPTEQARILRIGG
jgi:uroporphyrinogen III methyltransferase/synthase